VARICRRICLLRESHQAAAAEELRRGELAAALVAIRATVESDAVVEQKLEATFAAEAERVANAAVLAELLAPLLVQHTSWEPGSSARLHEPAGEAPALPLSAPPPRADPADIAHFIDEMIAQERVPPRTPPVRRAS
jgi:hypothetical protein